MRKLLFILRKVIKMHKVLLIMMALLLVPLQGWTDAHPPTGSNPPITGEDMGGVKAGAIVEWLVLDPPIMTGQGSVVAAGEDSLKDIYPKGEAQVMPEDGETFESPGAQNKGDTITWRRINFLDLGEQGITDNGAWPASGNCFDWKDWGARDAVNNFTEYAITWAMWNKSGSVDFFLGVDDSGVVYADGKEVINAPNASQNWGADQHKGTASIAADKWIHIVVKVGESAGECGFTLRTEPVAGEVTTTGAQVVTSQGKLSITWGNIKAQH